MISVWFGRFLAGFSTESNQSIFGSQEPTPTDGGIKLFDSVVIKSVRSGQFGRFADLGCYQHQQEDPKMNLMVLPPNGLRTSRDLLRRIGIEINLHIKLGVRDERERERGVLRFDQTWSER